jgi:hypothetical protein
MRFYFYGIRVCWQMFGLTRDFLHCMATIMIFFTLHVIKIITLSLDLIFCPEFKRVQVRQPVFIIGHPRSGTTFMHKLFTQTDEMAAYFSWQILFPAISARKVVAPIVNYFRRRGMTTLIPEETGHGVGLDKVEEEELLFLHNNDTQFNVILTPLGFLDDEFKQYRLHDQMPHAHRIKSAQFLKSLFQRHIYYTGKTQIFAQTHFSTHRIKTLMEVFPDARFIYMHRMPEETLPSAFSLIENMIDLLWGMHRFSENQKRRFFKLRYQASIDLYKYFYDLWQNNEIDKSRVMIVPYRQLKDDLMDVFNRVVKFTGITPSQALVSAVAQQAEKQKQYQRIHTVRSLEEFGIDSGCLKNDFAFLYGKGPFPAGFEAVEN